MRPRLITAAVLMFFGVVEIIVGLTGNVISSYIQMVLGNNIWIYWLVTGIFVFFGGLLIGFEIRDKLSLDSNTDHLRPGNFSFESLFATIDQKTQTWIDEKEPERKIDIGKDIIISIEQAIIVINKERIRFTQFKKEIMGFIEKYESSLKNEIGKTEEELLRLPKEIITGSAGLYFSKRVKKEYLSELQELLSQLRAFKSAIHS